jgi:OOP family OmpA-OmpF porin
MRIALLYIFLCFAFVVKGQNLVNNPSFEEYTECPDSINFCRPYIVDYWGDYSYDLSVYENSCIPSLIVQKPCGVPFNYAGGGCFQYPQQGNGCILLENIIYPEFFIRSQIQTQLVKPLDSLECYYFSMYINLCDSCLVATDDIGVLFAKNFISLNFLPNPYDNFPTPQIFHPGEFIQEKEGWFKYEGSFTATGGEEYMLIGSFSKADSIDYVLLDNGSANSNKASYLVDNITLIECDQVGINEKPISPIKAYPNPSNGMFTIENTKPIKQLKIYNTYGQLLPLPKSLPQGGGTSNKVVVDLTHLPAGIYLCNLDGYSIKLIKE